MSIKYSESTRGFYKDGVHTSIPLDAISITDAEHASLLEDQSAGKKIRVTSGVVESYTPSKTDAELIADATTQIDVLLNSQAYSLGYDTIFTAMTYVGDSNTTFAAEAAALKSWRSTVWTEAAVILVDVQAGNRSAPADIVSELTAFPGVV